MTIADRDRVVRGGTTDASHEADALARTRSVVVSDIPDPSLVDPIALYEAAVRRGLECALWLRPSEGQALVAIGRAWSIDAGGPDRIATAEASWRELAAALPGRDRPEGVGLVGPVLVGGLGFDAQRGDGPDGVWAPFPAASMVLPELSLAIEGGRATLTTVLRPGVSEGSTRTSARGWETLLAEARAADGAKAPPDPWGSPRAVARVLAERPGRDEWGRQVRLIAGAVGRGRLDKAVLARRLDVRAAVPFDRGAALRSLVASAPEGAIFAFGRGDRTFLGATPERLVRVRGRAFQTMAVAGSTGRGADAAADAVLGVALQASEKDREEHAVVVDMLRARLAPISERLAIAPAPVVLSLRHVQHLVTEIEGVLRERITPLALAERLHPTPAVAGEPTDLALAFIAELEDFDRGWYAGPVGWVNAAGDGELMVALRSAVIRGAHASLFAGCGIVADSDPETEWQESRIKLRTIAAAMGISEGAR